MDTRKLLDAVKDTRDHIEKNLGRRLDAVEADMRERNIAMNRPHFGGGAMHSQSSEATKAFAAYMKSGRAEMDDYRRKALVQDDQGQVLVPEDLDAQIYQALPETAVMRQVATVRSTSRDRVRRRSLGKPAVGWGKLETGQQTLVDSAPTPGEDFLFIEDLYGLVRIGEDELSDVEVDLGALMRTSFAEVIAEEEDRAFFNGGGHDAYQPEGLLTGDAVERVQTAAAGTLTLDDFLNLIYAVPSAHRRSGAFVVNSDTERLVRQMADGNGQYLWQPSVQLGAPNRFFGYPIYSVDDVGTMPGEGAPAGADVAVFGDFKYGYQIRDRQANSVQRLSELYAEEGLVGFKVRHRVGGAVVWPDALRVLRVAA
jgi:HK97 family phage major capsid protein